MPDPPEPPYFPSPLTPTKKKNETNIPLKFKVM